MDLGPANLRNGDRHRTSQNSAAIAAAVDNSSAIAALSDHHCFTLLPSGSVIYPTPLDRPAGPDNRRGHHNLIGRGSLISGMLTSGRLISGTFTSRASAGWTHRSAGGPVPSILPSAPPLMTTGMPVSAGRR